MPKVYRWTRAEHRILRGFVVVVLAFAIGLAVSGFSERDKTVRVRFVQRSDARTETTAEITYDGDFEADRPGTVRRGVRIEYDPDDPQLVRLAGEDRDRGI